MYEKYLKFAEKMVVEGGQIALTNFQQQRFATKWKEDHSLVTSTDTQIENLWRENITKAFPGHQIFGEEFGGSIDTGKPTWILDPLDGTTNFSNHVPLFCSMAALQVAGEVVCAAISSPIQNLLFTAFKDGGAFINEEPFPKPSAKGKLENITLLLDSGKSKTARERSYQFINQHCHHFRSFRKFGCMVAPLLFATHSKLELEIIFEVDLYDVAGLSLIFQEAGYTLLGENGTAWHDSRSGDFVVTTPTLEKSIAEILEIRH